MKCILVFVIITCVAVLADKDKADREAEADSYDKELKSIYKDCEESTGKDDREDPVMKECVDKKYYKLNPHHKLTFAATFEICKADDPCIKLEKDIQNGNQTDAGHWRRKAKYELCLRDCVCGEDLSKCGNPGGK